MNENIKNLWDTALEEFSKEHQFATIMLPAPLREKFAELIVKEMCNVLEQGQDDADMNTASETNWAYINVLEDWITRLKEHFGVKE